MPFHMTKAGANKNAKSGKETVVILMRHLTVTLSIIAVEICAQFTYT